jgi:hypothetical protein
MDMAFASRLRERPLGTANYFQMQGQKQTDRPPVLTRTPPRLAATNGCEHEQIVSVLWSFRWASPGGRMMCILLKASTSEHVRYKLELG